MINLGLNFKQTFKYLVPTVIRGEKFTAWIGALLAPLQSLNTTYFAPIVTNIRYTLAFSSQVIYLERRLNNDFDNTLRRIYIDDPSGTFTVLYHIWNASELQPLRYIYNAAEAQPAQIYLYSAAQYNTFYDFFVYVPNGVFTTQQQISIRNTVTQYRHTGRRFNIATF